MFVITPQSFNSVSTPETGERGERRLPTASSTHQPGSICPSMITLMGGWKCGGTSLSSPAFMRARLYTKTCCVASTHPYPPPRRNHPSHQFAKHSEEMTQEARWSCLLYYMGGRVVFGGVAIRFPKVRGFRLRFQMRRRSSPRFLILLVRMNLSTSLSVTFRVLGHGEGKR